MSIKVTVKSGQTCLDLRTDLWLARGLPRRLEGPIIAMPRPPRQPAPFAPKFEMLLEACRHELRLPHWNAADFGRRFSDAAQENWGIAFTPSVVTNLREGQTIRPIGPNRDAFAALFRIARPDLRASWFNLELDEFRERLAAATADREAFTIYAPKYTGREPGTIPLDELTTWLTGLYVSYRYSYEESDEYKIAREVLYISETEGRFYFRLWYARGGTGGVVEDFNGVVIPIGKSLYFTGASSDRGRTIVLRQDRGTRTNTCRIGMMTSSKVQKDASPVAACVVMFKLPTPPPDCDWRDLYCSNKAGVVGVFPRDVVLREDFMHGSDDLNQATYHVNNHSEAHTFEEWMRIFVDNVPLRPEAQIGSPIPDGVLRLHLDRFYRVMFDIHARICADADRKTPLKPVWADQQTNGAAAKS